MILCNFGCLHISIVGSSWICNSKYCLKILKMSENASKNYRFIFSKVIDYVVWGIYPKPYWSVKTFCAALRKQTFSRHVANWAYQIRMSKALKIGKVVPDPNLLNTQYTLIVSYSLLSLPTWMTYLLYMSVAKIFTFS